MFVPKLVLTDFYQSCSNTLVSMNPAHASRCLGVLTGSLNRLIDGRLAVSAELA